MIVPVNSEPFLLRGFTAELEGNENAVVFARPVVASDGVDYVVEETDAGDFELRRLANRDREYVRWFPEEDQGFIDVSEGVWVAGPQLIRGVNAGRTKQFSRKVQAWAPLRNGYRWTTGTNRDYLDFMQVGQNLFEAEFHYAVFLQSRKKGGSFRQSFKLYQAFALEDTLGRALNSALFYSEAHELRSYSIQVADAVLSDHAGSNQEFETLLSAFRNRLIKARIGEELEERFDKILDPMLSKVRDRADWALQQPKNGFGLIAPDGVGTPSIHVSAFGKQGYVNLVGEQSAEYSLKSQDEARGDTETRSNARIVRRKGGARNGQHR